MLPTITEVNEAYREYANTRHNLVDLEILVIEYESEIKKAIALGYEEGLIEGSNAEKRKASEEAFTSALQAQLAVLKRELAYAKLAVDIAYSEIDKTKTVTRLAQLERSLIEDQI